MHDMATGLDLLLLSLIEDKGKHLKIGIFLLQLSQGKRLKNQGIPCKEKEQGNSKRQGKEDQWSALFTHTHTYTHTHSVTHTHTHTPTRARAHARAQESARARTHAHARAHAGTTAEPRVYISWPRLRKLLPAAGFIWASSILTLFRLRFGLFGPWGREGPGTHFLTLLATLGPKCPNDPCSRPRESKGQDGFGSPEGPERHDLNTARQKLPWDNFCRSIAAQSLTVGRILTEENRPSLVAERQFERHFERRFW